MISNKLRRAVLLAALFSSGYAQGELDSEFRMTPAVEARL